MIEVEITEDMVLRAKEKSTEMGKLKHSMRGESGNFVGFLGEEVILSAFPGAISSNTYEYDIIFDGVTFEVKTKDRTVIPKPNYEVSIAEYNAKQSADFYVFVSLLRRDKEYLKAYIIGIMSPKEYKKKARLINTSFVDNSNGFKPTISCFNLYHHELHQF